MTARHEIILIIKQHMESIEKAPSNATVFFVAKVKKGKPARNSTHH